MEAWLWVGVSSFAYIWVSQVHEGISSYNNDILCQVMWPGWAVFFSSVLHPSVYLSPHIAWSSVFCSFKKETFQDCFWIQTSKMQFQWNLQMHHLPYHSYGLFIYKHFLLEKSCTLAGPYNMAERWIHVLHWVKL